jgi:hypothetical protein
MKKNKVFIKVLTWIGIGFIIFIVPFAMYSSIVSIKQFVDDIGKEFLYSVDFVQMCIGDIILLGLLVIGGAQILVLIKKKKTKRDALHGCATRRTNASR